jgi:hypothetical protein
MKRAVLFLSLTACTGMGCVSMPSWWEKSKAEPTATVAEKPARLRPPVTAEQISESNAREMASALLDELNHDSRTESSSGSEKPK